MPKCKAASGFAPLPACPHCHADTAVHVESLTWVCAVCGRTFNARAHADGDPYCSVRAAMVIEEGARKRRAS